MARQGKIFLVDDVMELSDKQHYEADVVIIKHGTVVMDRKGIVPRQATSKELHQAKRP